MAARVAFGDIVEGNHGLIIAEVFVRYELDNQKLFNFRHSRGNGNPFWIVIASETKQSSFYPLALLFRHSVFSRVNNVL